MELRDLVMMTADAEDGGRIVNTGDLCQMAISEAAAEGRMWIDPATGYGFVFLPWTLTTDEDRQRETAFLTRESSSERIGTDGGEAAGGAGNLLNDDRGDRSGLAGGRDSG